MAQRPSSYGVLIAAICAVLLLLFVYSVADVLFLLFISVLFSLYLSALTDILQDRFRLPRAYGITVALLLTVVGATAIGWLIVARVLEQTEELIATLPALLARWEASLLRLAAEYPLLQQLLPEPGAAGGYFGSVLGRTGEYFAGVFPYVFSGIEIVIHVFSVLVMGIYITLRPEPYAEGTVALFPPIHRGLVRNILKHLSRTLRAWIVGQILAMVFLGVLTWIGLMLLQVPYALTFGVFTGIVAIVPFFGTLISTLLPALFVLGSSGVTKALLVVLLGAVIHLIEANFIHPIIMQRQVHLPPVLSILSVLIMAELLGVVGLLVAVPVLASTLVIVRRIYVERILEGTGFRREVREPPPIPPVLDTSAPAPIAESAGPA